MYEKQCTTCFGVFKANRDNFYKNLHNSDGLQPTCKECCKKASKRWREMNRKKVSNG